MIDAFAALPGQTHPGAFTGLRTPVPGFQYTEWPLHAFSGYAVALTSSGFQMLLLCVSGIRNKASRKHTAGTAIG